jgi:hypothetical protein
LATPAVGTDTVVDPEPVNVEGLNEPVKPEGLDAMLKVTVPLKPPEPVTVTVNCTVLPALTDTLVCDAANEKSPALLTVWVKAEEMLLLLLVSPP